MHSNEKRKLLIDEIINLCHQKNWWDALEKYNDYIKDSNWLWKHYDHLFNYQINKCGMCRKMKYTVDFFKDQLTCTNEKCSFYLIFNCDLPIKSFECYYCVVNLPFQMCELARRLDEGKFSFFFCLHSCVNKACGMKILPLDHEVVFSF